MPTGTQFADGPDAIRHAIREQVRYGADWIKYYADGGTQFRDGVLHSRPNYTDEETAALVAEAHRLGHKVAAHAGGKEAIESALAPTGAPRCISTSAAAAPRIPN